MVSSIEGTHRFQGRLVKAGEPSVIQKIPPEPVPLLSFHDGRRNDEVDAILSGEWISALECYIQTCTDEFYRPYDDTVEKFLNKYIKEGLVGGRAQSIIRRLLNDIQDSADGLKLGMSIYWTEDST